MARVLVPTMVGDEHACAVYCAARRHPAGLEVVRWFGSDFPATQSGSFRISDRHALSWRMQGPQLDLHDHAFDVVWLRRPAAPVVPGGVHPDDRDVVRRESLAFYRSLWHVWGEGARWINPHDAHLRASNKVLQLKTAREVGLSIPATLIANDPDDIHAFIEANRPQATVYKGFYPASWSEEDGRARTLGTAVLDAGTLPEAQALRLTPGIYQAYVDKRCEIRATFMGADAVALRIHSQRSDIGRIDWRRIPVDALEAEPASLPPDVYQSCLNMMKRLGLCFACFDFIVTPAGAYVFLEVNEMGQFLWKDCVAPQLCMLDRFIGFLSHPSDDFQWRPSAKPLNYRELLEDADFHATLEEDRLMHAGPSTVAPMPDAA